MSRYRKFTTICCAAVFALGLAACGGGDDGLNTSQEQELQSDKAAAEKQVADLTMQINALRAQLGLDPDGEGDPAATIQDLQDEVARLQGEIADRDDKARMDQEEADRMAAAKTGKELFAALGGPADGNALGNINVMDTALSNGLTVNAASGAGSFTTDPDGDNGVNLKAGDSPGPLGSWAGTSYANTNAESKVVNEAVVYSNQGPGRSRAFSALGSDYEIMSTGDLKGYVTLVTAGTPASPNVLARVMAAAFNHSANQNHSAPDRSDAFYTRGEYAGAPGEFRCTGDCSSTNDGKGSPSALGGTWHFKPDAGANAMTHQPDADYLYYGWWVSKDKDGMPTAASAFTGMNGTVTPIPSGADPMTLEGSAMYAGHAAGKFALDYSKNKVLDGASDGGHFTADVMLTAKFGGNGAPNNGGVSGTINNFMANGESVDWSVSLHRATWDASTVGAFATPETDVDTTKADETMGTTWSIDGTAADRSGTWSGQMYDEMLGDPPAGDGSTVPTTVTGTFYSQFDKVGRMVGAFGANKQ